MGYKNEDIIYVLTKTDVEDVAEKVGIRKLTDEHYRRSQKYVESFCGGGAYTWCNAIQEALEDVEAELRLREKPHRHT